jgi:hypothetical protein
MKRILNGIVRSTGEIERCQYASVWVKNGAAEQWLGFAYLPKGVAVKCGDLVRVRGVKRTLFLSRLRIGLNSIRFEVVTKAAATVTALQMELALG